MAYKTHDKVSCKLMKLIGTSNKFLKSELPTLRNVLKHGLFLEEFKKITIISGKLLRICGAQ